MEGLERAIPCVGSILKFEVSTILKVLLDRYIWKTRDCLNYRRKSRRKMFNRVKKVVLASPPEVKIQDVQESVGRKIC